MSGTTIRAAELDDELAPPGGFTTTSGTVGAFRFNTGTGGGASRCAGSALALIVVVAFGTICTFFSVTLDSRVE